MGADRHPDWRAAAASALDWWREAGVDVLVDEAPRDWLAPEAMPPPRPADDPATPTAVAMPGALDAFLAWRLGPDAPEAGWPGRKIAAEGPVGAALAVVLDCPDREDLADGRLLSGPAGRLFERMLAAIGLERDLVYLFAAAATRPLAGRITGEVEARLGAVARRQLALARPDRVLLMGNAAVRSVLGMNCAEARGSLHVVNHERGEKALDAVAASFHPRQLLREPRYKAEAWRDLLLVMGGGA